MDGRSCLFLLTASRKKKTAQLLVGSSAERLYFGVPSRISMPAKL